MLKILTIASMSLALATGSALAQDTTASTDKSGSGTNIPPFTEADRTMMEDWRDQNTIVEAFFMDDTMTEFRSDDEIAANWANLTPEQQATVRADCDRLTHNRGEHSQLTLGFCAAIDAL